MTDISVMIALSKAIAKQAKKHNQTPLDIYTQACITKNLKWPCVSELRPTAHRGQGLFAKQVIQNGTIIDLYPSHVLGFRHPDRKMHEIKFRIHNDLRVDTNILPVYSLNYTDKIMIVGLPNESRPGLCAHMCNDGAYFPKITKAKYKRRRKRKNNCKFLIMNGVIAIRATKNIKQGCEILVDYGFDYWVSHVKRLQTEAVSPRDG